MKDNDFAFLMKHQHVMLPDGIHQFHAYADNGYIWAKVTHLPSGKIVDRTIGCFLLRKGWKQNLLLCLRGANTKYRDRTPEQHAKGARFYKSDFVPT